jgi:DNA-binding NarL/FixJ family response regulator
MIIVDFKMPPFGGLQIAREICKTRPSVPIVMYTLYKTDKLEASAKLAGIRSVVGKENGICDLLHAIDVELATRQSQMFGRA